MKRRNQTLCLRILIKLMSCQWRQNATDAGIIISLLFYQSREENSEKVQTLSRSTVTIGQYYCLSSFVGISALCLKTVTIVLEIFFRRRSRNSNALIDINKLFFITSFVVTAFSTENHDIELS